MIRITSSASLSDSNSPRRAVAVAWYICKLVNYCFINLQGVLDQSNSQNAGAQKSYLIVLWGQIQYIIEKIQCRSVSFAKRQHGNSRSRRFYLGNEPCVVFAGLQFLVLHLLLDYLVNWHSLNIFL